MKDERIIRRPEVEYISGRSRSDIYKGMKEGTFPKNVRIGERAVGWVESQVRQWVTARIDEAKKKRQAMAEAEEAKRQLQAEAEAEEQDKTPEQQEEEEDAKDVAE